MKRKEQKEPDIRLRCLAAWWYEWHAPRTYRGLRVLRVGQLLVIHDRRGPVGGPWRRLTNAESRQWSGMGGIEEDGIIYDIAPMAPRPRRWRAAYWAARKDPS